MQSRLLKKADGPLSEKTKNDIVGLNNSLREVYHEAKAILEAIEDKELKVKFIDDILTPLNKAFTTTKAMYDWSQNAS